VIAIDTNILVRALLNDDPIQSPLARKTMERARSILVPVTVIVELAWVLKSAGWTRSRIYAALVELEGQASVHLDRAPEVHQALEDFRAGKADFADYLALNLAKSLGARALLTFDQKLARSPGAERLG